MDGRHAARAAAAGYVLAVAVLAVLQVVAPSGALLATLVLVTLPCSVLAYVALAQVAVAQAGVMPAWVVAVFLVVVWVAAAVGQVVLVRRAVRRWVTTRGTGSTGTSRRRGTD